MDNLPTELQSIIVDFSNCKHRCLFVCKAWNLYIIQNPPTSILLTDIENNDLYAIRYKYAKILIHDEFYLSDVIDKVIELNKNNVLKIFIDVHYKHWLPAGNWIYYGAKIANFIISGNNIELQQYIGNKVKYENIIFVPSESYDWRYDFFLSIAAFYFNKKEKGREAIERLLTQENIPELIRKRSISNAEYYL